MASSDRPRRVGVVLFDRFELLDVFGPLELLGVLPDRFELSMIGPSVGPIRSAQGPEVLAGDRYTESPVPDIVLMPGGIGTRCLVGDGEFLAWLPDWADSAQLVTSVCTGSGPPGCSTDTGPLPTSGPFPGPNRRAPE